jgi:iron complex outermembrane receptor protein
MAFRSVDFPAATVPCRVSRGLEVPMQRTVLPLAIASLFHGGAAFAQAVGSPGTQVLAPVVVTGTPIGSELFELVAPVTTLSGRALQQRQATTLGEMLNETPGVSSSYFGPNASRPVIRGLDGDRVQILQNGSGVIDASAASPDHAVSIEPLNVERVEVVRGPATLMYGGNAIGGVVNVIDARIPQSAPARPIGGAVDTRFGSNNRERSGGFRIDGGNDRIALHVDASRRITDDLRIPGFQYSRRYRDRLQANGSLDPGDDGPRGRLANSASETENVGVGGSFLFGDRGYAGLAYSDYSTRYGTVAEPDVRIGMHQKRLEFASEIRPAGDGFVRNVRTKFAHSDYRHTEYDRSDPGTLFTNKGWDGRVELQHRPFGRVQGAFGVQATSFRFNATGDEAFLPPTETSRFAGFVYEEWAATDRLRFSAGGRLENYRIRASDFLDGSGALVNDATGNPLTSAEHKYNLRNGALGAAYALGGGWTLSGNATYSERGPNYQELYAFGPHLATAAFEIGDRGLSKERSRAFDLGVRRRGEAWGGSVTAFNQKFSNFIAQLASGICYDAGTRAPTGNNAPCDNGNDEFEAFNFTAVPATFRGVEADGRVRAWGRGTHWVDLEVRADYTRATNDATGQPLPRIPPLRFGGGVVYRAERWGGRLDVLRAQAQNRTAANETATDGYTRVDATASYTMRLGAGVTGEWFLRGVNLLNQDIRYSTSFLKDIAPAGKRGVIAGLRASF